DRALAINPNFASAWYFSGWTRLLLGEAELALEHFRHARRLSPLDPFLFLSQSGLAMAYFLLGQLDEASLWARSALRESPRHHPALRLLAASSALAGRLEDAHTAMARLREIDPTLRVGDLPGMFPFRLPGAIDRYTDGLRKAGLPE